MSMKAGDFPNPSARSGLDAQSTDQASNDGEKRVRRTPNFGRSNTHHGGSSGAGASAAASSSSNMQNPPLSTLGLGGGGGGGDSLDALGSFVSKKAPPRPRGQMSDEQGPGESEGGIGLGGGSQMSKGSSGYGDSSLTGGRRRREMPIPESKFRSGSGAGSAAASQQGDEADGIGDLLGLGSKESGDAKPPSLSGASLADPGSRVTSGGGTAFSAGASRAASATPAFGTARSGASDFGNVGKGSEAGSMASGRPPLPTSSIGESVIKSRRASAARLDDEKPITPLGPSRDTSIDQPIATSAPAIKVVDSANIATAEAGYSALRTDLATSQKKEAAADSRSRRLERDLEELESTWKRRVAVQNEDWNSERSRMETTIRRLEQELEREKDQHRQDQRTYNDQKETAIRNAQFEKDQIRREEGLKLTNLTEQLRIQHNQEVMDLNKRHEEEVSSMKRTAESELNAVRKGFQDQVQVSQLMERVQQSVVQVEKISSTVKEGSSDAFRLRAEELDKRERIVKDMEQRTAAHAKEVEEQRRRVADMMRDMQDASQNRAEAIQLESKRLDSEHQRLQELQHTLRQTERINAAAMESARDQLEADRRSVLEEKLEAELTIQTQKEEAERLARWTKQQITTQEQQRKQIEATRLHMQRRLEDNEKIIAEEKRKLVQDAAVFEERRELFQQEKDRFLQEQQKFQLEQDDFQQETEKVAQMAIQIQQRSEQVSNTYRAAADQRAQAEKLKEFTVAERTARQAEFARMHTMQETIETKRMALFQSEQKQLITNMSQWQSFLHGQAIPEEQKMIAQNVTFSAEQTGNSTGNDTIGSPIPAQPTAAAHGGGQQSSDENLRLTMSVSQLVRSSPAMPNRSVGREELHAKLKALRNESGQTQVYIAEQHRFIQEAARAPVQQSLGTVNESSTLGGNHPQSYDMGGLQPLDPLSSEAEP